MKATVSNQNCKVSFKGKMKAVLAADLHVCTKAQLLSVCCIMTRWGEVEFRWSQDVWERQLTDESQYHSDQFSSYYPSAQEKA